MGQISNFSFGAGGADEAMLDGLKYHVRIALRKKFEEAAAPIINDAVEEAMKEFEVTLKSYRDFQYMRDVVEVILTDKRSK